MCHQQAEGCTTLALEELRQKADVAPVQGDYSFLRLRFHRTSVVRVMGSELCGESAPQSECRSMQWLCLQVSWGHGGHWSIALSHGIFHDCLSC